MKKHFKAVELKHLDEETILKIREWRNQPFVKEMMYSKHDITEEEHRQYIDSLLKDENRGLFVFYLDEVPFGVYQYVIHPEGNYVVNGNYLVDREGGDLGYGAILLYYMNEIAFDVLHVNKCFGEVLEYNKRAISLNKRIGSKVEGILRQHVLFDGRYYDVYQMGMLKSEWSEYKEKLKNIIDLMIESVDII